MTQIAEIQTSRSRQEWAEVINADWRKSIEGIIQVGRDLVQAKDDLPNGQFSKMCAEDLTFSPRTAERLMSIANSKIITNATPASHLPPSWVVLAELAKLSENDFQDAQQRGLIDQHTGSRAARAITGAYESPAGGTVGNAKKPGMLPAPSEAKKIARETSRLVAASDGNIYSGATDEEREEYVDRRQQVFGIIDGINDIANCQLPPQAWLDSAEKHWLHDFRLGSIDAAVNWLIALRPLLAKGQGVIDAE